MENRFKFGLRFLVLFSIAVAEASAGDPRSGSRLLWKAGSFSNRQNTRKP
jgi:hypothetical protein